MYFLATEDSWLVECDVMKAGSKSASGLRKSARVLLWSCILWFAISWAVHGFAYLFYLCLFYGLVLLILDVRRQSAARVSSAPVARKTPPKSVSTVPAPPKPARPSGLLNGRYEPLRQLKTGGMAVIVLAKDHQTNSQCVIKTPKPGAQDAYKLNVQKLTIEGAHLREFNHPRIVKFVDLFTHAGEPHLVVEYVQGQDLDTSFATRAAEENRVIKWAAQILDALQYIHLSGYVHRDLNPGNIMLKSNDDIVIIDFGTIKPRVVAGGTIVSKPGFEIPEQARGYADEKSDIYGVGSTLFYLLTCTPVGFLGSPDLSTFLMDRGVSQQWVRRIEQALQSSGRTDLAKFLISLGVSQQTANCITQALELDPKARFGNAQAMRTALSGRP